MKHVNSPNCPSCDEKLKQAHPVLKDWFLNHVKPFHENAHIAWSFRDEASQNKAYQEGMSALRWPNSKHNSVDKDGKPCARALDLFEINSSGKAVWDYDFYDILYSSIEKLGLPIAWGGQWKSLKDTPHFELFNSVK